MNNEGIGLGLNIVKQIVELCGGKKSVHSEGLGQGSKFCFSMIMMTQTENLASNRDDEIEFEEVDSSRVYLTDE